MQIQHLATAPRHAPSPVWREILALAAALSVVVFMDALKNPAALSPRAPASNARPQR